MAEPLRPGADHFRYVPARDLLSRPACAASSPGSFLPLAEEFRRRRAAAELIRDSAERGKLFPHITGVTGAVFFHRFFTRYIRLAPEDQVYSDFVIAVTCLLLAGKVEDTPKHLREILRVSYKVFKGHELTEASRDFTALRDEVLELEPVMLRMLEFELFLEPPFKSILRFVKGLDNAFGGDVAKMRELVTAAFSLSNKSYDRTVLSVQYPPAVIGAGAVHAALIKEGVTPTPDCPKVWDLCDVATKEEVEDVSRVMLRQLEDDVEPEELIASLSGRHQPVQTEEKKRSSVSRIDQTISPPLVGRSPLRAKSSKRTGPVVSELPLQDVRRDTRAPEEQRRDRRGLGGVFRERERSYQRSMAGGGPRHRSRSPVVDVVAPGRYSSDRKPDLSAQRGRSRTISRSPENWRGDRSSFVPVRQGFPLDDRSRETRHAADARGRDDLRREGDRYHESVSYGSAPRSGDDRYYDSRARRSVDRPKDDLHKYRDDERRKADDRYRDESERTRLDVDERYRRSVAYHSEERLRRSDDQFRDERHREESLRDRERRTIRSRSPDRYSLREPSPRTNRGRSPSRERRRGNELRGPSPSRDRRRENELRGRSSSRDRRRDNDARVRSVSRDRRDAGERRSRASSRDRRRDDPPRDRLRDDVRHDHRSRSRSRSRSRGRNASDNHPRADSLPRRDSRGSPPPRDGPRTVVYRKSPPQNTRSAPSKATKSTQSNGQHANGAASASKRRRKHQDNAGAN